MLSHEEKDWHFSSQKKTEIRKHGKDTPYTVAQ